MHVRRTQHSAMERVNRARSERDKPEATVEIRKKGGISAKQR